MPREIHSFANDTVKRIRGLRDKKERKAEGKFLAEGLRILTEARMSGVLPLVIAYCQAMASTRWRPKLSPQPKPRAPM